jgi:hypothetical protein
MAKLHGLWAEDLGGVGGAAAVASVFEAGAGAEGKVRLWDPWLPLR